MLSAKTDLMKLQLAKDKTIEVKLPWGKTAAGSTASFSHSSELQDVTGVSLFSADSRGCPAVRLQWRKKGLHLLAAGFVPPPEMGLPTSWEESKLQTAWQLPVPFQAPQAALAVTSSEMFITQTTMDALASSPAQAAAAPDSAKKKLGIKRNVQPEKPTPSTAKASGAAPVPFIPTSKDGVRSVIAPLAEDNFVLQTGLPEYQVMWLAGLLPEGRRPTACSIQTAPAARLSALQHLPDFIAADGCAVVVFVTPTAVFFAGYREGALILFRECPGVAGSIVMHELVQRELGVEDELVDSILEDTLINPQPALEPFVRPILLQLRLSLDYLAQRHDLHVDHVFLMGLPAGALYWSQFAQEMLGMPFIAPNVFDGLIRSTRANAIPDDLSPAASQAFLPALGAALAAMEGS